MSDAANETQADDGRFEADSLSRRPGPAGRINANERLITVTQAAWYLPKVDGKKVSVCTLWRWCRKGLRGAFLEYVRVGRKICTTREAMLRFFTELAELDERIDADRYAKPASLKRSLPKAITSRQRQRALA
ncbi:MAG: hypothetical protein AMK72_02505 [Planctomycetes bacterium SM23_25]|nr:MAG: hypothetical protein AMK72_02505 [Planctomycetes bacterium SM23_25]